MRCLEAIFKKVAADRHIDLPNDNEFELALHDETPPPREENRLPSPSGFADAQSGHSDDEQYPTARSEEEFVEPDLPAPRINSLPDEQRPLCEGQAGIIDQGTDVWHFAPKGITRPQILDHENTSDNDCEVS